jgi:formate-dependent nitrite reductase membrane component NrfD
VSRVGESQPGWGLSIAAYLFLGGLGAGAFVAAIVLDWADITLAPIIRLLPRGVEIDLSALLLLWGPVAVAIGAALLLAHLGRNRRLFMTAGRNVRGSWLSRGFSIIVVFICLGGLVLALAALAPGWIDAHLAAWRVLQAATVLAALATATYTGLLLYSMGAIPAWHTPWLPPLFVASALTAGAKALVLALWCADAGGLVGSDSSRPLEVAAWSSYVLLAVEALTLCLYVWAVGKAGPAGERSARLLLRGARRWAFWGVVVGLGMVAPVILLIAARASAEAAAAAAASALAGGFMLRVCVLGIGLREYPPLYGLGVWRAAGASGVAEPTGDRGAGSGRRSLSAGRPARPWTAGGST